MSDRTVPPNGLHIGWYHPGSKRFIYTDEKEHDPQRRRGYTVPVVALPDAVVVERGEIEDLRHAVMICRDVFAERVKNDVMLAADRNLLNVCRDALGEHTDWSQP